MVVLYSRCMDKVLISCFTGISYVNRLFLLFWAISQVFNGDCDLWNDDSKAWGLCFSLWTEGMHISLNNCSFSQDLNHLTWIYLSSFHVIFWVILCMKQKLQEECEEHAELRDMRWRFIMYLYFKNVDTFVCS